MVDRHQHSQFNQEKIITRALNELRGIAYSVIYDGKIDDAELSMLRLWITDNAPYLNSGTGRLVVDCLNQIYADGIVTQQERTTLFNLLFNLGSYTFAKYIDQNIYHDCRDICFSDHTFCISGQMIFCNRNQAAELIEQRGGKFVNSVSLKTNYLIIGDLGNESYALGNYGRKIQYAMDMNATLKSAIWIIKEQTFIDNIMRSA